MRKQQFRFIHFIYPIILILVIILAFTLIDYAVHTLSEEYAVPSYYFKNKIIFGTIFGLLAYILSRKMSWIKRSFVVSGTVAVLLQVRYALEGYNLKFVIEFLILHFFMILAPSLIVFWLSDRKKTKED